MARGPLRESLTRLTDEKSGLNTMNFPESPCELLAGYPPLITQSPWDRLLEFHIMGRGAKSAAYFVQDPQSS